MDRQRLVIFLLLVLATATGAFLLQRERPQTPVATAPVAATIFPLYDIVRQVAGDAVAVTLILPPGAEPHSYEPSPSDIRALADTQVVYAIGHGLEHWIDPMIASTSATLVTVDRGIAIRTSAEVVADEGESEEEHEHGETDPHYWLSMPNAMKIVMTVREDLSARFPEHAAAFQTNSERYLSELADAHAENRMALAELPNRNLVTFHDAWYYFADAYGLAIVGSFEPTAGREPTPQYLAELLRAIDTANAKTLYTEPLFSDTAIGSFANDQGLKTAELDDIGGRPGTETYIDLMRSNVQTILNNQ